MQAGLNGRSGRRALWIGALVVAAGGTAGLLAAWGSTEHAQPGQKDALTADRAVAKKSTFAVVTVAGGELEARNKIEIRNPLDQQSTIVEIAPEGSWAHKGDLLVRLNTDELQNKIDDENLRLVPAKGELAAAVSSYDIQINENESKLRQAELKLALADLALSQWEEGDVKKKRQEQELAISKAELELDRLAQKFVRSQDLFAEGFLSKDERDRDEVAYIQAISEFTTAHLAREVYENYEHRKEQKSKQSDVDEARAELDRVKLNNKKELEGKEARVEQQRAQVGLIENRLKKLVADKESATMYAPADGLVVYSSSVDRNMWGRSEGPLQIGQQVYPNQLLIMLPDTSEMIAAVRINESLAGKVRPGQPVTVKVDAAGGAVFDGEVESIGVMAESGGWRDPNLREYTVKEIGRAHV